MSLLRAHRLIARVAIAALLLIPGASRAASVTDRQARLFPLPADRTLTLEVTIGTIRIEGEDRVDVEIVAERQVPTTAAVARLPIVFEETPSRVIVRAVQTEGGTDATLRVDLVARVPRTAVIESVQVMEGRISVTGFRGRLTADVRRGPIEGTDVSGTLRLETGIGSVVLTNARLSPGGLLRLRAFNGDVRLGLAERPADARILALALNGTIRSEIPLTVRDTWGPRWSEATLGRGEPLISIDVVTGAVEIRLKSP